MNKKKYIKPQTEVTEIEMQVMMEQVSGRFVGNATTPAKSRRILDDEDFWDDAEENIIF